MAGLSPKQVAGRHLPMFEIYYLSLDPTGKGQVPALEAARFLKRSGLSDAILSKIWDLSDPTGKGYLDKLGVFVGLKLVAFAQNGRDVSLASILDDSVPEPEMSSDRAPPPQPASNKVEPPRPQHPPAPVSSPAVSVWTIKEEEFGKYRQLYNGLGPEAGKIPGGKAKSLLMDSKLPVEILGKIWDLADVDKDGSLSEGEFAIAMHFVYKSLEKHALPDSLPPEMQKLLQSLQAGVKPPLPPAAVPPPVSLVSSPVPIAPIISAPQSQPQTIIGATSAPSMPVITDNWIVPYDERAKFKSLFHSTDLDRDGYVSGSEIKGLFLQSGLQQQTLAHIWNLCDTDQSGKLSADQFTLAMWLVSNALKGIPPPTVLTPEMCPPGMTIPQPPPEPELSPEFELIMKEINELTQEKLNLELDIAVKESDKKIKSGESKSLQSELDTLAATLKQLENQRTIAQGKLSELDGQVSTLRFQAEEQEATLVVQELEVSSKAAELKGLDQEEKDLLSGIEKCGRDIEKLGQVLQDTLLQISQAKSRVASLTELEETMKNSIVKYTSAIESNNAYTVTEPELRDVKSELDELIGVPSPSPKLNGDALGTSGTNGFPTSFDSFSAPSHGAAGVNSNSNSWDHDPFGPSKPSDPFAPRDPFAPHDPFAPAATTIPVTSALSQERSPGFGTDSFGAEPFEAETAPALPPKKAPPRPAPPKNAPARPPPPSMKPALPAKADPFSQGDNFDAGFADFSNFNNQTWGSSSSSSHHSSSSNINSNFSTSNNHHTPTNGRQSKSQDATTPLEFTEDPFKNYRYEDPFANADPFAGL